jgi:TRAP-type uncharacterized transport system substrate-binding protein
MELGKRVTIARPRWQLVVPALSCVFAAGCTHASRPQTESFEIASGNWHQTYHAVGAGLATLIQTRLHKKARAVATGGSLENVKLLAAGTPRTICLKREAELEPAEHIREPAEHWEPPEGADRSKYLRTDHVTFNLGFVNEIVPELDEYKPFAQKIAALALLWDDYCQVVVNPWKLEGSLDPKGLLSLEHLGKNGLRIYPGPPDSAINPVAAAILYSLSLEGKIITPPASPPASNAATRARGRTTRPPNRPTPKSGLSTEQAVAALVKPTDQNDPASRINALFVGGGLPTRAVQYALGHRCILVQLPEPATLIRRLDERAGRAKPNASISARTDEYRRILRHLRYQPIPDGSYDETVNADRYRDNGFHTLTSRALLVASNLLPAEDAEEVLNAIFEPNRGSVGQETVGQEVLLNYHQAAEEIRVLTNLREWRRSPLPFHPGARKFWRAQEGNLLIASGPLGSTGFHLGVEIAQVLNDRLDNVHAMAINTDDSAQSIKLLHASTERRSKRAGRGTPPDSATESEETGQPSAAEQELESASGSEVGLAIIHSDDAAHDYAVETARATATRKDLRLRRIAALYPEAIHFIAATRHLAEQHAGHVGTHRRLHHSEPGGASATEAHDDVTTGAEAAVSLRDWLVRMNKWLVQIDQNRLPVQRRKFAIARDLWSPDAWSTLDQRANSDRIFSFYKDLQGGGLNRIDVVQLSLAQIEDGLVTGRIEAALVPSGLPMEAVSQIVRYKQSPRLILARALSTERCQVCDGPRPLPAGFRVLPLDTKPKPSSPATRKVPEAGAAAPESNDGKVGTEAPKAPDSIEGLVAGNPFLRPTVIPASTYRGAQRSSADTVALGSILACAPDCRDVYNITRALVEDEVRLRTVAGTVDLRNALESKEPSIPFHREARRYYEEQGLIQRVPPKVGVFWDRIVPALIGLLTGIVSSMLSTIFIPEVRDWVLSLNRPSRRRRELERRLRRTYFAKVNEGEQLEELHKIWLDVAEAYAKGELKTAHADGLNSLIRGYEEQLRKQIEFKNRTQTGNTSKWTSE